MRLWAVKAMSLSFFLQSFVVVVVGLNLDLTGRDRHFYLQNQLGSVRLPQFALLRTNATVWIAVEDPKSTAWLGQIWSLKWNSRSVHLLPSCSFNVVFIVFSFVALTSVVMSTLVMLTTKSLEQKQPLRLVVVIFY